jgi:hypothetical protein
MKPKQQIQQTTTQKIILESTLVHDFSHLDQHYIRQLETVRPHWHTGTLAHSIDSALGNIAGPLQGYPLEEEAESPKAIH